MIGCRQLEAAIQAEDEDDEINNERNAMAKRTEQDYSRERNIRQARKHVFEQWTLPPKQAIAELVVESDTNTRQRSERSHRGRPTLSPPAKSCLQGAVGKISSPQPNERKSIPP